jgi:hypothetical protein
MLSIIKTRHEENPWNYFWHFPDVSTSFSPGSLRWGIMGLVTGTRMTSENP